MDFGIVHLVTAAKLSQKDNISYPPDKHTHVLLRGIRNDSFSENFYVCTVGKMIVFQKIFTYVLLEK